MLLVLILEPFVSFDLAAIACGRSSEKAVDETWRCRGFNGRFGVMQIQYEYRCHARTRSTALKQLLYCIALIASCTMASM